MLLLAGRRCRKYAAKIRSSWVPSWALPADPPLTTPTSPVSCHRDRPPSWRPSLTAIHALRARHQPTSLAVSLQPPTSRRRESLSLPSMNTDGASRSTSSVSETRQLVSTRHAFRRRRGTYRALNHAERCSEAHVAFPTAALTSELVRRPRRTRKFSRRCQKSEVRQCDHSPSPSAR